MKLKAGEAGCVHCVGLVAGCRVAGIGREKICETIGGK